MERGKVLTLCRVTASGREPPKKESGGRKPLPAVSNLWELLDRNISIDIWRKEQ
jgi:hypothetical protein